MIDSITSARLRTTLWSASVVGGGDWLESTSFTPSTSNTSTEWCATIARPASVMMSGCGTFAASHASWITRDHVVRVFLGGVVLRGVEVGARSVVVDAEAAADVEQGGARAELVEPHEDPARLGERVLVGADRGDLRADVEVQELEAVEHVLVAQPVDRLDDLERGEPELRAVAGRIDPLARAARGEPRAHADVRADPELARGLDQEVDLVEAVDHDDRGPAEPLREQRGLDVGAVLVAVADDQRAGRVEQRERDQQLGLAAGLEADAALRAVLHDLLDHVPLLVHLDRVDAAERAAVAVLADRVAERVRDAAHARGEDVGEADQERRAQAALLEVAHELEQVDAAVARALRAHFDVAAVVHGEESRAPGLEVVELEAVAVGPTMHGRHSPLIKRECREKIRARSRK